MLASTILWHVCSWSRWYLFRQLEQHPEMTSWHKTYHCWQAAKVQVGWSRAMTGDQRYLLLWKISELLALSYLCRKTDKNKSSSYEIPDEKCILWYLSLAARAKFQHLKWSKEIKFHWPPRTWFPLSPHSLRQLLHTCYTLQELMRFWLRCRSQHHLLSKYTKFPFSLFALLPPRCPDIPIGPISSSVLRNFRLTSSWHVSGES